MSKSNLSPLYKRLTAIFQWGNSDRQNYYFALESTFFRAHANFIRAVRSYFHRYEVDTMSLVATLSQSFQPIEISIPIEEYKASLERAVLPASIFRADLSRWIDSFFEPYSRYIESGDYSSEKNYKSISRVQAKIHTYLLVNNLKDGFQFETLQNLYRLLDPYKVIVKSNYFLIEKPLKEKKQIDIIEDIKIGSDVVIDNIEIIKQWSEDSKFPDRYIVLEYFSNLFLFALSEDWRLQHRNVEKLDSKKSKKLIYEIFDNSLSILDILGFSIDKGDLEYPILTDSEAVNMFLDTYDEWSDLYDSLARK